MGGQESGVTYKDTYTMTVVILLLGLVLLLSVLIFLYNKLNKEANGEYTVQRMVYKEGGIRDRVRGAALALETRLGVQLWPNSDADDEGEEMQEIRDEEGQLEVGCSRSCSEGGDEGGEEDEDEQGGKTSGQGGDTSGEMSSSEGSEAGEQDRLADQQEAKEGRVGDLEGKGEASGGSGLLINLKQISGSVTWSEHDGGECKEGDVTAL